MSEPLEYTIKQAVKGLEAMISQHSKSWEGGAIHKALNSITGLQKRVAELEAAPSETREALQLLSEVFDAWENGDPCYEDPDDSAAYLGMAFRLPDETFHACCDLLNKHYPKINNAAIPPVSGALDERETLDAAIAASQSTEA